LTDSNIVSVDSDGDGRLDRDDNGPNDANADPADADNDGIGDVCDTEPIVPATPPPAVACGITCGPASASACMASCCRCGSAWAAAGREFLYRARAVV
jgi:hypothetical protein